MHRFVREEMVVLRRGEKFINFAVFAQAFLTIIMINPVKKYRFPTERN